MINYIPRKFTVIRDRELCINCGCCVRQCSNECHYFDEDGKTVLVNSKNCVACHRCVDLCPTGALRIEKYVCDYRDNANWTPTYQQEICRQADTGSVLLSAMGNPKPYPIYWDKILLNASQVTNPSIDPLREPMEIRTILGRKPNKLEVERKGKSITKMPPQVMLETPIMFSAMSFGSISLNAQKSLAMAAVELGTLFNTGEGGLHPDLRSFGDYAVVQVASGRFGVHKDYLNNSKFIEIKIGQGAKPGIGGHLPGEKVNVEVSNARMIPEGSDAISPAPHHDIYSIEDLRQLIWSAAASASSIGIPTLSLILLLPQVLSVVHPILLKQLLSVQMLAMLLLLPLLQWAAICAKHVIPVSVIGVLLLSVLTLHVVLILKSHIKG